MAEQNPVDQTWTVAPGAPTSQAPVTIPPRHTRMVEFARHVVVAVLIALLLVTLAFILWRGIAVLLEAFAGVLFAIFLATLADWLSEHTRLTRGWALLVIILLLVLVFGGLSSFLANRLAVQIGEMTKKLPQSLEQVHHYLSQYAWGQLLLEEIPKAGNALPEISQFTKVTGFISGVADFLITVVVIIFVGIFGAAEPQVYRDGLLHLVPPKQRTRTNQAVDAMVHSLRWWLIGQICLMIIIGVTTMLGLWLIGVPLALTLGVIAGVMELVPYVGPWISAVPAAMMSLLLSPWHLVAVLGLYLFLHILEGYVLLPLIQRRAVELPPALTLVAQVLLGELLGLIGLFVAAPLTVCIMVLLKMLYVEDTLGDQDVDVPGEPGNENKPAALEARDEQIGGGGKLREVKLTGD